MTRLLFLLFGLCLLAPTVSAGGQDHAGRPDHEPGGELDLWSTFTGRLAEPVPVPPGDPMDTAAPALRPEAPRSVAPRAAVEAPPGPEAARREAFERFLEEGEPPVVALPTTTEHPYGWSVPRVRCVPYRACILRLEAGESVLATAIGDSERWQLVELTEGSDTQGSSLAIKPSRFDLLTNLALQTDRRLYLVELQAPPAPDGDEPEAVELTYDALTTWWYPEQWVERRRREAEPTIAEETAADDATPQLPDGATPAAAPLPDPTALNFDYRIRHPWRRNLRWEPTSVFDDGARTFIRLPAAARQSDLPAVLGVLSGGDTYPIDARLEPGTSGDWLVVPAVAARLRLVVGTGDSRRSLTLVNRAHPETR